MQDVACSAEKKTVGYRNKNEKKVSNNNETADEIVGSRGSLKRYGKIEHKCLRHRDKYISSRARGA